MAKLGIDFNQVEAATGKQPAIPTGWQMLRVVEEEIKPTANNATTGNELVAVTFEVIDGPHNGRKIFKNFNYKNENQQAQDIGWGEMKALNEATRTTGEDTAEWVNVPFKGYVVYVPKQIKWADAEKTIVEKEYDEKNEIRGFKTADDESVELNHAAPARSGGSTVQVSQDFKGGKGSPVPSVGANAAPAGPKVPPKPVPKVAPKAPPAKKEPVLEFRMTEKADGTTEEEFQANDPDWTRELLIEHGYAEWVEVEPAADATPTEETKTAPKVPPKPAAAAAGGATKKAPWEKK